MHGKETRESHILRIKTPSWHHGRIHNIQISISNIFKRKYNIQNTKYRMFFTYIHTYIHIHTHTYVYTYTDQHHHHHHHHHALNHSTTKLHVQMGAPRWGPTQLEVLWKRTTGLAYASYPNVNMLHHGGCPHTDPLWIVLYAGEHAKAQILNSFAARQHLNLKRMKTCYVNMP